MATVQANLAEMKVVANQILATGLVLPDPFREAATFDTVVSAIATATTATAASDFATAKTQIADINTKIDGLLDGKLWTGVVSRLGSFPFGGRDRNTVDFVLMRVIALSS